MRYTLRTLLHNPGFTAVAVVSLAPGIGANTALFVIDAMLLRPLPIKNPGRLVEFARSYPCGSTMTNMPQGVYEYLRRNNGVADVFALSGANSVLRAGAAPERCNAQQVSGEFFPALGVNALFGLTFGPDANRPGSAGRVVVLSYRFWRTRFGEDGSILGTTVRLDSELFTVIGVMPPSFIGVDRADVPDFLLPLSENPRYEPWVLGRLKPGISIPQAQAALEADLASAINTTHRGSIWVPESVLLEHTARVQTLIGGQLAPHTVLSAREAQVVDSVIWGRSNKEIASIRAITERTVKLHVSEYPLEAGPGTTNRVGPVARTNLRRVS